MCAHLERELNAVDGVFRPLVVSTPVEVDVGRGVLPLQSAALHLHVVRHRYTSWGKRHAVIDILSMCIVFYCFIFM